MSNEVRAFKSVYDAVLHYIDSNILEEIALHHMEANKYTALYNAANDCCCHIDDLAPESCNDGVQLCCEFGYVNDCATCKKRDDCKNYSLDSEYIWIAYECWEQDVKVEDNGF